MLEERKQQMEVTPRVARNVIGPHTMRPLQRFFTILGCENGKLILRGPSVDPGDEPPKEYKIEPPQ